MFYILLILSIYNIVFEDTSDSYFQKFSFLQYGFNANAKFKINFTLYDQRQMVFGLATESEIKAIDKLKEFEENCLGNKRLSAIQFNVTNNSVIQGAIPKKSLLTPYSFTCSLSYKFASKFDYSNGSYKFDYRCQIMLTFALVYLIIVASIVFISLFTFFCIFSKQVDKQIKIIVNFTFYILVLFSIQDLVQYLFFLINKKREYFNESISDDDSTYVAGGSGVLISIICPIILLSCAVLLYFNDAILHGVSSSFWTRFITLFLILMVSMSFGVWFILDYIKTIRIICYFAWLIYCVLLMIYKPLFSILKGAVFMYMIGFFIFYPLGLTLVHKKSICTHFLIILLAAASIITQTFSLILFLWFIFTLKDNSFMGNTVQNNPIHQINTNYYTFNDENVDDGESGHYDRNEEEMPLQLPENNKPNLNENKIPIYINSD